MTQTKFMDGKAQKGKRNFYLPGKRRALLAALLLTGVFCVPAEAAERTTPLVVTEKDQTIHDDFGTASQPVRITDGKTPAVLEIASSAADKGGVTTVNSNIINGTFTVGGSKGNVAEANGIWVQDNYPGTVKLANGLNIKVDAAGNHYHTFGIYLEGVDTHNGHPDESDAANDAYTNTYNGHISPTTVHVGDGTTITINGKAPEGMVGESIKAAALENHFGHMTVGDDVNISIGSETFKTMYPCGLSQYFYGDTCIGKNFTATVRAIADVDTENVVARAINSNHMYQEEGDDTKVKALTHNQLTIGNDAHLVTELQVKPYSEGESYRTIQTQGMFLDDTDFFIGGWIDC